MTTTPPAPTATAAPFALPVPAAAARLQAAIDQAGWGTVLDYDPIARDGVDYRPGTEAMYIVEGRRSDNGAAIRAAWATRNGGLRLIAVLVRFNGAWRRDVSSLKAAIAFMTEHQAAPAVPAVPAAAVRPEIPAAARELLTLIRKTSWSGMGTASGANWESMDERLGARADDGRVERLVIQAVSLDGKQMAWFRWEATGAADGGPGTLIPVTGGIWDAVDGDPQGEWTVATLAEVGAVIRARRVRVLDDEAATADAAAEADVADVADVAVAADAAGTVPMEPVAATVMIDAMVEAGWYARDRYGVARSTGRLLGTWVAAGGRLSGFKVSGNAPDGERAVRFIWHVAADGTARLLSGFLADVTRDAPDGWEPISYDAAIAMITGTDGDGDGGGGGATGPTDGDGDGGPTGDVRTVTVPAGVPPVAAIIADAMRGAGWRPPVLSADYLRVTRDGDGDGAPVTRVTVQGATSCGRWSTRLVWVRRESGGPVRFAEGTLLDTYQDRTGPVTVTDVLADLGLPGPVGHLAAPAAPSAAGLAVDYTRDVTDVDVHLVGEEDREDRSDRFDWDRSPCLRPGVQVPDGMPGTPLARVMADPYGRQYGMLAHSTAVTEIVRGWSDRAAFLVWYRGQLRAYGWAADSGLLGRSDVEARIRAAVRTADRALWEQVGEWAVYSAGACDDAAVRMTAQMDARRAVMIDRERGRLAALDIADVTETFPAPPRAAG